MENITAEIFFLNPEDNLLNKAVDYLENNGFVLEYKKNHEWKYTKNEMTVSVCPMEDGWGKPYIYILCWDIEFQKVIKPLSRCPECGSDTLIPVLMHGWESDATQKAYHEGRLRYLPGAYDRFGTRPPTRICSKCGFMWHNSADAYYWYNIIKSGNELTEDDLGIK